MKKRRNQPELALAKQVALYLNVALPPEVFWTSIEHSGTGAYHGQKLKAKGVKSGVPDVQVHWMQPGWVGQPLMPHYRIGWIELKAPKGVLSNEQKAVRDRLHDLGHRYAVCRSVSDVAETLAQWGTPVRARIAA